MLFINFDIQSFISQTITFAIRTLCSPPVPTKQYPVLNFVKILFNRLKKLVNAVYLARSSPQQGALFVRKASNWSVSRQIYFSRSLDTSSCPPPNFFSLR